MAVAGLYFWVCAEGYEGDYANWNMHYNEDDARAYAHSWFNVSADPRLIFFGSSKETAIKIIRLHLKPACVEEVKIHPDLDKSDFVTKSYWDIK